MKKILFLVLTMAVLVIPEAMANSYTNLAGNSTSVVERKVADQVLFDTSSTTSTLGIPIYTGFAPRGAATTDNSWRVCKASETANITTVQSADGAWSDRATLSYS